MDKVFSTMLEIGIYSGVIVLIVLILRLVFHKASKTVICALWFLVGLRLLLFVPIESSFAIMPRLSIKEMVREYSESTDMVQPLGTAGKIISDNKENIYYLGINDRDYKQSQLTLILNNALFYNSDIKCLVGVTFLSSFTIISSFVSF